MFNDIYTMFEEAIGMALVWCDKYPVWGFAIMTILMLTIIAVSSIGDRNHC